jgi:hypothetical protein
MHSEGFDLDCSFICICHVHHYDSNSSATLFQERSDSEQHNPCTTLIVSWKFLKHLARKARWIRRPRSLSRLQLSSVHTASNSNQKLQPNEDEWHSEIPVHSKRPTENLNYGRLTDQAQSHILVVCMQMIYIRWEASKRSDWCPYLTTGHMAPSAT